MTCVQPQSRAKKTDATEARRRSRDKCRRRMLKQAKRSMWREIWPQVCRFATWCAVMFRRLTTTSNKLLLTSAHALVAPELLSGLTEPDELATALSCQFALDIWTIMPQEAPSVDEESLAGRRRGSAFGNRPLTEPVSIFHGQLPMTLHAPRAGELGRPVSLAGPRLQHRWACLCMDVLSQFLHFLGVSDNAKEAYVKVSGQLALLEA